ncbi:MAG: hypothetical protein JWM74_2219 [Myxococcaceae bacterium]|nr:hypothetical protein [Myxococcaceae bacterium]
MNPIRVSPLVLACVATLAACASQLAPPAPAPTTSTPTASEAATSPPAAPSDARPRGAIDPHVHDPVTADELGISEELGVVHTDAGGCTQCGRTGTLSTEARAAIVAIARRSRHCYGVARVADTRLHGTIKVDVTIGAQGDACSAIVHDGTMHSRAVDDCVEKLFREMRGVPGITACVNVSVPLAFEGGEVQPETPK